jgi:predicted acyltransferase
MTSERLVSLDVFRGLTMAAMVIVNNPGDWGHVYRPLLHADWHGCTPTDLIFPFFLFIVGVSITFSKRTTWWAIVRRSALIIALGLFLAGYPRFDFDRWRIPGVLQRIGVCYLIAASLYRIGVGGAGRGVGSRVRSQLLLITGIAALLSLAYWAVMMLVPPPGGVAGDLSPEGNLGAWLDRALMEGYLWRKRWDPEGLLSTLPAVATTLLGIAAGMSLAADESRARSAGMLAAAGAVAAVIGLAWGAFFPINKNLWTSSYVFFTAGLAAMLLAVLYWAIDVRGWRGWTKPFVILGTNAITLFVVSGLFAKTLGFWRIAEGHSEISAGRYAFTHWFAPLATAKNASLLYALANLVILFLLLAWMYRRRLFLRV